MTETCKIRPPLRYPGSKYRAYKYIEPFVNHAFHDEYREPFLGSGAVFFQKSLSQYTWLNDLDDELINFYKIIQNPSLAKRMALEVCSFVPSKQTFESLKHSQPINEYDRALKYFLINRTAYSGIMNMPNWGFHISKSVQPCQWGQRILSAAEKLQNCKITSLDYEQVLFAPAQGKKILFFIDPPYFSADQKRAYVKSFVSIEHIRLADNLKKLSHDFILTYDDCDEIRNLYSWANIYPVEFMYHTANSNVTTRKKGKEVIITNFDL